MKESVLKMRKLNELVTVTVTLCVLQHPLRRKFSRVVLGIYTRQSFCDCELHVGTSEQGVGTIVNLIRIRAISCSARVPSTDDVLTLWVCKASAFPVSYFDTKYVSIQCQCSVRAVSGFEFSKGRCGFSR